METLAFSVHSFLQLIFFQQNKHTTPCLSEDTPPTLHYKLPVDLLENQHNARRNMLPFNIEKRSAYAAGWILLAVVGIFAPDLGSFQTSSRSLAAADENNVSRELQATPAPTPPIGLEFSCGPGEEEVQFDFSTITLTKPGVVGTEIFQMANGYEVTFTTSEHGTTISEYNQGYEGYVVIGTDGAADITDVIDPNGGSNPEYPENYVSLTISFDRPIDGLRVAVSALDSTSTNTAASRITLFDRNGNETLTTISGTGDIKGKNSLPVQNLQQ
jgi:hypothetical protein